ncbi:MAG: hypothetical protein CVT88_07515 [Candidatus Altiarchaeales archaeon HGW-Altiarchaeales-1]|nr:MAG: hypothetical protein CVT88_07515 [Candidatus Altiarchaeales archaeon HGW-Altiarchaeales-1]
MDALLQFNFPLYVIAIIGTFAWNAVNSLRDEYAVNFVKGKELKENMKMSKGFAQIFLVISITLIVSFYLFIALPVDTSNNALELFHIQIGQIIAGSSLFILLFALVFTLFNYHELLINPKKIK